jgi:hypothetical protein
MRQFDDTKDIDEELDMIMDLIYKLTRRVGRINDRQKISRMQHAEICRRLMRIEQALKASFESRVN